jgi:hypothetical protein
VSTSFSTVVQNLNPGYEFRFLVTAVNDAGEGPASAPSLVVIIPEEGQLYLSIFKDSCKGVRFTYRVCRKS